MTVLKKIFIGVALSVTLVKAEFRSLNQVEISLYEQIRDHESQRRTVMQLDPRLCQIAREHCESMNENNFFSHTDPTTGKNANDRLIDTGYPTPSWYQSGSNYIESIALNDEADPGKVLAAWFGSSGHRRHVFGLANTDGSEFYVNEILIGIGYVKKAGAPQGYYAFVAAHVPTGEQATTWRIPQGFQGPALVRVGTSPVLKSLPAFGVCCIQIMAPASNGVWEFMGCGVADEKGAIVLPQTLEDSGLYRITWDSGPYTPL